MKLIFCSNCSDVVRLLREWRSCHCGQAWGRYLWDGLHADIGGTAIPLGFDNQKLTDALSRRPRAGRGRRFVAFVIAKSCDTVLYRAAEEDTPVSAPVDPDAIKQWQERAAQAVPSFHLQGNIHVSWLRFNPSELIRAVPVDTGQYIVWDADVAALSVERFPGLIDAFYAFMGMHGAPVGGAWLSDWGAFLTALRVAHDRASSPDFEMPADLILRPRRHPVL